MGKLRVQHFLCPPHPSRQGSTFSYMLYIVGPILTYTHAHTQRVDTFASLSMAKTASSWVKTTSSLVVPPPPLSTTETFSAPPPLPFFCRGKTSLAPPPLPCCIPPHRARVQSKGFENGSGPCLHGTYDEVGTTKHNWSVQCQYNVIEWVSMWAYDPVIPLRQHYKEGIESHCYKWAPHLIDSITQD